MQRYQFLSRNIPYSFLDCFGAFFPNLSWSLLVLSGDFFFSPSENVSVGRLLLAVLTSWNNTSNQMFERLVVNFAGITKKQATSLACLALFHNCEV